MSHPREKDDYNIWSKQSSENTERKLVQLVYGKNSKLPPDTNRPCYLFKDREKTLNEIIYMWRGLVTAEEISINAIGQQHQHHRPDSSTCSSLP